MLRAFAAMVVLGAVLTVATSAATSAATSQTVPDAERVEQLAGMLPDKPRGFGPTIEDRQAWEKVAAAPRFGNAIRDAKRLLEQPIPELNDDLYLDYSRTGNRTRAQKVIAARQRRYPVLALAECIENRGRFIPAIEQAIGAVCSDKTWVMPAHDHGLHNFRQKVVNVDLRVANEAWNLATVYYWLGDKLSPEVRKLLREELERRTFTPFEQAITTGKPRMWWINGTNNWNAVCLAGVTGSALTMIESPRRRAFFVAAAEKCVRNFLRGFTSDGYCSEGVGYWNYGFGHYVMLSEAVRRATGGKVDMLEGRDIEQIATFGRRMEIDAGVYPAFADCSVGTRPDTRLMAFLSRRYGFGLRDFEKSGLLLAGGPSTRLFSLALFGFADSGGKTSSRDTVQPTQPPRDWFPEAGILICRPSRAGAGRLGAAVKGGNNAEHHNHNDVGSYLVALADKTPLVDPGSEVYTARTFSSRRYESDVLNSFGHPVPRVAGKLQQTGRSAAAKVKSTHFTDKRDTIVLDLRAAYDVEELRTLDRTFIFSREGQGSLTVVDRVEFAGPADFETALVTFSKWKQITPNRLLVGEGAGAVQVDIDTAGAEFRVEAVEIKEDVKRGHVPIRLGIELTKPATKATIRTTITPAG